MAQPSIDAVLAGTKGFAVALLAPVTTRVGVRPRVAADPGQVLGLCGAAGGLVVVEFMGEGSLAAIQALVRDARRLRVVAGVPAAHAGADETLRALGVEVARWDGKVEGMLGAIERALGATGSAPPQPPPATPAAARPAPAASAPGPVPAPPRQATPPVAAQPAATASRPAQGAGPAVALRPSAPPAPVAPRPPSRPPQAAGPAPRSAPPAPVAPRPPAAPSAPRLQAVAAPPAAPSAPRLQAVAAPPAAPSAPRLQAAGAPAVAPRPAPAVVAPAPAAAEAAEAAPVAPRPVPVAQPKPRPAVQLFDDLDGGDLNVDVADLGGATQAPAAPGVDLHAPGLYVPPPSSPRLAWPAGVCAPDEAEEALRAALAGQTQAGEPLGALAQKTLESLSDLERAVLAGEPQPVDVGPIRKAAVMRLRVAEALGTTPPAGSGIDSAALSGILGEIDALLAEVAPLLAGAPAGLAPALETIRNALVSEAIDFSEAAQRVASQTASTEVQKPAFVPARVAQTRVLSVQQESDADRAERRRGRTLAVALAVAVALVLGYHGHRYWQRSHLVAPVPAVDAPAGLKAPPAGGRGPIVLRPTGKGPVDAAALKRFREQQEAQGKQVFEMENGSILIVPQGVPPPLGVKK